MVSQPDLHNTYLFAECYVSTLLYLPTPGWYQQLFVNCVLLLTALRQTVSSKTQFAASFHAGQLKAVEGYEGLVEGYEGLMLG